MTACLIALGSNLGDRQQMLDRAVDRLAQHPKIQLVARSGLYPTRPVGGPLDQDEFLNGVVRVETALDAHVLLNFLLEIESELGRRRRGRWGPRTIDLDLLLYGDVVLDSPPLVLPHPRMSFRRFVLEPAAEVASDMIHPVIGWTIAELFQHICAPTNYVAMAGPIGVGKRDLAAGVVAALQRANLAARIIEDPIDADRLAALHTNPTGHAWQPEIEFLRSRSQTLDIAGWPNSEVWTISDFWFDQSLAYADVWLPGERVGEFRDLWRAERARVVTPKLLVALDRSTDTLVQSIRSRGREQERPLSAETIGQLAAAIRNLTTQPGHGPVLFLNGDDRQENVREVTAAIMATIAS